MSKYRIKKGNRINTVDELAVRFFGSRALEQENNRPVGYVNGNYYVRISNGSVPHLTKTAFRCGEELISEFPDSIDLKITNFCSWGCPFCHESSNIHGKHFNLENTKNALLQLPNVPLEIAIGGGNVLECPETVDLLSWMRTKTLFLPRITISIKDIEKYSETKDIEYKNRFEEAVFLANGLGVSIYDFDSVDFLKLAEFNTSPVCHVILGICKPEDIRKLICYMGNDWIFPPPYSSVLILGYKQFGRAKDTELPKKLIEETRETLLDIINDQRYSTKVNVCFDNLAIEQLGLSEENIPGWERFYMGGEGEHSMYIDAVEETYAKTSRSDLRVSWSEMGLVEFFNKQKNDTINF